MKERLDLSKLDNLSDKVVCVLSRVIVTPNTSSFRIQIVREYL